MAGSNERTETFALGQGGGLRGRHPVLFALLALDLGLVVLQYALGMYVNLYVQIPFGTGWGGMMGMGGMWGQPALVWHMMNGWLVFLVTLLIAIFSLLSGDTKVTLAAWAGLLSVAMAGVGGMGFLMSGGANGFSLLMALGALGALLSLSAALFLAWNGGAARSSQSLSSTGNALGLLDMRYARGEIDREEYLRAKHDLTET
jgi:putative membrane protein